MKRLLLVLSTLTLLWSGVALAEHYHFWVTGTIPSEAVEEVKSELEAMEAVELVYVEPQEGLISVKVKEGAELGLRRGRRPKTTPCVPDSESISTNKEQRR